MKAIVATTPLLLLAVCLPLVLQPAAAGEWPEDCGKSKSHNFVFGGRSHNDRILYTKQVIKDSKLLSKHSFDQELPAKGQYQPPGVMISAIEVLDQYTNGDGGCAYLKSGGPGFSNAVLHLKSQRGEGINFVINVYGRS